MQKCDINSCNNPATWKKVFFVNEYWYCDYHQRPLRNPIPQKQYWKKKK